MPVSTLETVKGFGDTWLYGIRSRGVLDWQSATSIEQIELQGNGNVDETEYSVPYKYE